MIQAVAIRVSGDKKLGEAMASAAAMQEIKRLRADLSYTRDRLILTRCARNYQREMRLEEIYARMHRPPTLMERVRDAIGWFICLFVQPD